MYDLVIRNGLIVTHENVSAGNIAIQNGKIAAITSAETEVEGKEVIDAQGKYVFPGGIDTHAHLNDPGYNWREDYIHGTQAAAAGGITTFIDMPMQNEPALTTAALFNRKEELLKDKGIVDYVFWGGLIDNNVKELVGLYEAGAVGYKAFIGPCSPDYTSVTSGLMRHAMQEVVPRDIVFGFHCEDYSIIKYEENKAIRENRRTIRDFLDARPVSAEMISVENVIRLAKETGARVHICHVSHPDVAQLIREAKAEGVKISGETCSHYLIFNEDDFLNNGPIFKCAPPLRTKEDQEALWEYVLDGTLSCVASDHSPCTLEEKAVDSGDIWKSWGGISGIQSTFQVMYDAAVNQRKLSPKLLAQVLSYGPAQAFNLFPRKGVLAPGFDADIVILDPEKEWEITPESLFYVNKISAFVGLKGKGIIEKTLVRGKVVFDEGKITAATGTGRLLKRQDCGLRQL